MHNSREVYPIERIISALSYITAGGVGFIWLIIAALMKKMVTPFLMYHIIQSIFISIAYFLAFKLYELLFIILIKIPVINIVTSMFNSILINPMHIFLGYSLLQVFTTAVVIYLVVTSFMGQYSYIPWVSNIINQNTGRG